MEAYKHKRNRTGDVFTLNVISYVFCGLVALLCLIPFIIIISSSFSSEEAVLQNGFSLLPQDFSLQAYETVFREPVVVFRAYATTILFTLCGTVLGLLLQTMTAYVLARKPSPGGAPSPSSFTSPPCSAAAWCPTTCSSPPPWACATTTWPCCCP